MTAEIANLKRTEYMQYIASQKEKWDRYAEETTANERGREEERLENKTAFVTNLIEQMNLSDEKIAGLAQVSVEFVKHIRNQLNSK